jgi:dihydrofolate reductase
MIAIAAMSSGRTIGLNGKLPWSPIKEDFKWFKEFTIGKALIVGKNTFTTLPPLKNRRILVLSSSHFVHPTDVTVIPDLEQLNAVISGLKFHENIETIVAGGAGVYKSLLHLIDEFYVTHITGDYGGDTFMPPFEHLLPNQELVKEFDGHRVVKYSR